MNYARDQQIAALVRAGYQGVQIAAKLHCSTKTIKRVRETVTEIARCECGRPKYHTRGCLKTNAFRREARAQQPVFEAIINSLQAKLPERIPAEMREDIRQQLLLDVMEFVGEAVQNSHKYVRKYNQMFPYNRDVSLDGSPRLAEILEG